MARYRKVDPRIWNDAKFRELSDNAKLVFFMLLTHPSMTALGAMRGTVAGLAAEMEWTAEAFGVAFREVIAKGMAEHDPKAHFVGLPNFIRYNPPESPNVVKAWVGALELLPECEQRNQTVSRAVGFAKAKGDAFAEALPEAFRKGWPKAIPYQEQEQEQEQEQNGQGANAPLSPALPTTHAEGPPLMLFGNNGPAAIPPCPLKQLVDMYAKRLPELPKPRYELWKDGEGAEAMRQRWKWLLSSKTTRDDGSRYATTAAGGLDWFSRFFENVADSDFLMGRSGEWRADLAWLMKRANFTKVVQGNYVNREAA